MTAYTDLAVFIPSADGSRIVWVRHGIFFAWLLPSLALRLQHSLDAIYRRQNCRGLAGAMMVPVGLGVLRITRRKTLMRSIAYIRAGLVTPVLGPPVGGFITPFVVALDFYLNSRGLVGWRCSVWVRMNRKAPPAPSTGGFRMAGICIAFMYVWNYWDAEFAVVHVGLFWDTVSRGCGAWPYAAACIP